LALVASVVFTLGRAFAQSDEHEPVAVVEIGAAANRSITENQSAFGPTVAVEVTPIENWLELEAAVTRHEHSLGIDGGLLIAIPCSSPNEARGDN